MSLIVGVDGGGTRTRCAVSDGEVILGRGTSGGCNIVRLGEAVSRASLQTAIQEAFRNADLKPESAEAACIGVAGSAVKQVREAILRITREILSCPVIVVGDQDIAFEAAFGASPGILVISGTGSIAFGRSKDGRTARAGGHGFIVSDEGSGQWIGRSAVADCLRSIDAGAESALLPALLAAFHVSTVGELIQAANASPIPDFSTLLPVVLKIAESGDPVAVGVLKEAGRKLAILATLVAKRLEMSREEFRVAMTGSVLEHCALVREEFDISLKSSHPQATVIPGVAASLLGALTIAARELPIARPPQFR